jgi:hypothetical protein
MSLFRHFSSSHVQAARHASGGRPGVLEPVRIGAYLHSARDLFRVEGVSGERALIEDCRSGNLLTVPLSQLLTLKPVRAAGGRASDTAR